MRDPSHRWAFPVVRLQAYFEQAGLIIEQTESFKKEIEFGPWADRMGASEEVKTQLLKTLFEAPTEVEQFLTPRRDGDKIFFTLTEAVLIGRKG